MKTWIPLFATLLLLGFGCSSDPAPEAPAPEAPAAEAHPHDHEAAAPAAAAPAADGAAAAAPAADGADYTCPMHADVHASEPGTCPKCKMDLVLASADGAKAEKPAESEHSAH